MALGGLILLNATSLNLISRVRQSLQVARKHLFGVVYVYSWNHQNQHQNEKQHFSQLTSAFYSQATVYCPNLDVRVLQHVPLKKELSHSLGVVLFEKDLSLSTKVEKFVKENFPLDGESKFIQLSDEEPSGSCSDSSVEQNGKSSDTTEVKQYDVVALGGTFDRMHNAHKILLSEAVLRCKNEIIVGVTDDSMIKSKLLFELIENCEKRLQYVKEFLNDVAPSLKHRVVPISDPFGPTIVEKDIGLIVVSMETIKGAAKINEIRSGKNFPPLDIHQIDIYSDPLKQREQEEDKISSSSQRMRSLGERVKPPIKEPSIPYIIGLTGGIASGKSTVCRFLEETQSVPIVYCDELGHEAYKKGTQCFDKLVETFGSEILDESGENIDRQILGSKVFGNEEKLNQLTALVWPEIRRLAHLKIDDFVKQGQKIVILDAAVLIEAGWDDFCHEIWVMIVPKEEAIIRVQARNNLSKEEAEKRINSQLSNSERIRKATFVFSSLWEPDFTRQQVNKAYSTIKEVVQKL